MTIDLFDLAPPPAPAAPAAGARPTKTKGTTFDATTLCPLCRATISGIDPMRTCDACRATGAPARVSWELAKPKDAALVGEAILPSESSITVGPHPAQLKLGEGA